MATPDLHGGCCTTFDTFGNAALQVEFDSHSFRESLTKEHRFRLDLSNHNLIGVLQAYQDYKQKLSPRFSVSAIIRLVEDLEAYLDGQTIKPDDVTDEFYAFAQSFLLSGARGRVVRPSTIVNYFSTISAALSWGALHRCPVSETFKRFKVDSYSRNKVALSPEQVAHIYYFDIDKNKVRIKELLNLKVHQMRGFSFRKLKMVKDQFVLDCNIGQRYSDAHRLDESCFDSTGTIYKTVQQKTGGHATVYITKYAMTREIAFEILHKYQYKAPCAAIDINNFNKYLHLLLNAIGGEFDKPVPSNNKILGRIVDESVPMWRAITSHTARRTFASYGLLHGMSLPQIQKCTSHKDLRSLQCYTIVSDID